MTRGAIDLKVVGDRLDIVRRAVDDLCALPAGSLDGFMADRRNIGAADSFLRRALEGLFDTARHLLAKRFGEAGLEYRQVARACAERGLITDGALAARFVQMAGFRNRLTHHYAEVSAEELFTVLATGIPDMVAITQALQDSAERLAGAPD